MKSSVTKLEIKKMDDGIRGGSFISTNLKPSVGNQYEIIKRLISHKS